MAFVPEDRPYDVQHYSLSFEMNPAADPKTFPASVEIELKATKSTSELVFDAENISVDSIELVSAKPTLLKYSLGANNTLCVRLPGPVKPGQKSKLRVHYNAKINSAHSGMFRVTDPDAPERGPLFFTHLEPLFARKLFPSNDQPYDKATNEIRATVPKGYAVVANGKLVSEKSVTRNQKNLTQFHWRQEDPHSTYLVALAVGKFKSLKASGRRPEISMWVGAGQEKQAKFALDATVSCMNFFEKYLGVKYPWPKYATVGVPTFLWGGMENTSATLMNQERTLLKDESSQMDKNAIVALASHELAHQWFGDYVTMQWWDDIWLNEAFASHLGTLGTKHFFQNDEAELDMVVDTWDDYFRQEDGPRSHPIISKELTAVDDAFDAINYTKGENILRMLSLYLGEDNFRKGLKAYLQKFAFKNATYVDFFSTMEKASKEKLSDFRDSWILQRGYPIISYSGDWNQEKSSYALQLEQQSNHKEDKTVFAFRIPVTFHRVNSPKFSVHALIDVNSTTTNHTQILPAEPEWVSVNNRSTVLGKIVPKNFDEERLGIQALADPDPFARVWAAFTLLEEFKENGNLSTESEKTIQSLLESDPSPYVRNQVAEHLQNVKPKWLSPQLGSALLAQAHLVLENKFLKSKLYQSDPHGWAQWRAQVLGTLGRVEDESVLPLLAKTLSKKTLPVDDLNKASFAVAVLGHERSAPLLKEVLRIHADRSYRHKSVVLNAFGALAREDAADEIRALTKTVGSDYMGRIGRLIKNNQTLKNSKAWSQFLQDFILKDEKFGDEVKARIIQTIEEVKTSNVETMLRTISSKSSSDRMRGLADNILSKNF